MGRSGFQERAKADLRFYTGRAIFHVAKALRLKSSRRAHDQIRFAHEHLLHLAKILGIRRIP